MKRTRSKSRQYILPRSLWTVVKSIYLVLSLWNYARDFRPENLFSFVSLEYATLRTSACNYNYRSMTVSLEIEKEDREKERERERQREEPSNGEGFRIYRHLLDSASLCIILHIFILCDHISCRKFDIFGMNWLNYIKDVSQKQTLQRLIDGGISFTVTNFLKIELPLTCFTYFSTDDALKPSLQGLFIPTVSCPFHARPFYR